MEPCQLTSNSVVGGLCLWIISLGKWKYFQFIQGNIFCIFKIKLPSLIEPHRKVFDIYNSILCSETIHNREILCCWQCIIPMAISHWIKRSCMHKSELFSTAFRQKEEIGFVNWRSSGSYVLITYLVSVFFVKMTVKKSVNYVWSPSYYFLSLFC